MCELTTERLRIHPATIEKLQQIIEAEPDDLMVMAYEEMLDGCLRHPEQHLWYTVWCMDLRDGSASGIGDLCFKGLGEDGVVEIGYGIHREYEGRGLMTEAVGALVAWAEAQDVVTAVEAEAEEDNSASIRVLEKNGFVRNGIMGLEGPRFLHRT